VTPDAYRDRAERMHRMADQAHPELRRTLLTIVEQYHRLAAMADERVRRTDCDNALKEGRGT
jgi:hypothetical protein